MDAGDVSNAPGPDGGARDAGREQTALPTVGGDRDASAVDPIDKVPPSVDSGVDADSGPISPLDELWLQDAPPACDTDSSCAPDSACRVPCPDLPGLCGVPCLTHDDCSVQQQCFPGFNGGDATCFDVAAEGEACGIPFRRLCASGLTCFPLGRDSFAGACFRPCAPEAEVHDCGGDQCVGGWTNDFGDTLGVCGQLIERGDRCDQPFAGHALCNDRDICAPDGEPPSEPETVWTCRQRCDAGVPCAEGVCRAFATLGGHEQRACY